MVDRDHADGPAAAVCSVSSATRQTCLRIGCLPNGTLYLALLVGERLFTGTEERLEWSIDDGPRGQMTMTGLANSEVLLATPAADGMAALLDMLKRGSRYDVYMDQSWGNEVMTFGLGGSSAAISEVQASCKPPPPPLETSTDPIATTRDGATESCSGMGAPAIGEGLARSVDFDTDGRLDIVIDHGAITCGGTSPFCGSAGCPMTLWHNRGDGTYAQVFGGHMYGVEPAGPGRVSISMHGSACNRVGAEGCVKTFRVGEGGLTPD